MATPQAAKDRRARLKAANLCTRCGGKKEENRAHLVTCLHCYKKYATCYYDPLFSRMYHQNVRAKRTTQGKCGYCKDGVPSPGYQTCDNCRKQRLDYKREHREEYNRKRREKRRAQSHNVKGE